MKSSGWRVSTLCAWIGASAAPLLAQPISLTEPVTPAAYQEMTTKGTRLQPGGKPDEKKPELSLAIANLIEKQRKARAENNVEEEKQCLVELVRLDPYNPA